MWVNKETIKKVRMGDMTTSTDTLFGTDGIRGLANTGAITPVQLMNVAAAVSLCLKRGNHRHLAIIGKDTRLSGYMIEPALVAGFSAMGVDVITTGPLPTPAVAKLVRSMRADLGVMISASHNPYHDNGVKFFGSDGFKLSDEDEAEVARLVHTDLSSHYAQPHAMGRVRRMEDSIGRYIEAVKMTFPRGLRLDGLRLVLDCAHGAAYKIAPTIFWELGAEVCSIGVSPDGFNINAQCGSLHPEQLCARVIAEKADLGIALDGDADRLILCDKNGTLINGDAILAIIAGYWYEQGLLRGDGVAATVMSNMGLEHFLSTLNLKLYRTPVGDRHVVEAMRQNGLNLGGEQSGHIIVGEHATTGDGLIAALQVLAVMQQHDLDSTSLTHILKPFPQKIRNLKNVDKSLLHDTTVTKRLEKLQEKVEKTARIVVRPSGTEPLIRIMVECQDEDKIDALLNEAESILFDGKVNKLLNPERSVEAAS
jgi:phosphoglucosamine mutase